MFRSRVSGVGGIPEGLIPNPYENDFSPGQRACIGPNCQMDGGAKDLYPTRPGWDSLQLIEKSAPAPAPAPVLAVAKPTAFSLPLLLGAAYLLLS